MPYKKITDDYAVSTQISPISLADIKEAGFRTIMCNRPDGEEEGQPSFAEITQAAEAEGLRTAHIPFVGRNLSQEDIQSFLELRNTMPGPVFAYCKSGTRCATLWAYAMSNSMQTADIMEATKRAGYDLSALEPHLNATKVS